MTNAEIIALQKRQRALHEGSLTIVERLRSLAARQGHFKEDLDLMIEAADVIEWMKARVAQVNRDLHEEQRETQRAAGESYAEGRHDGMQDNRDW